MTDRPKPLPLPIVLDACQDTMHGEPSKRVLAWHFLAGPLPGVLRDGSPAPADGEILTHDDPLILCEQGLHASVRPKDALNYAPGPIVCRVECSGTIQHDGDKLVCTERRILWRADADATLHAFTRWCALSVIHLWDPPQVVRDYLETGREEIRAAAWDAAWGVARGAVAWTAADAAAWAAARAATPTAAPWAAPWAATEAAAKDAVARAAAKDAQNVRLEEMLMALAPAGGAQ